MLKHYVSLCLTIMHFFSSRLFQMKKIWGVFEGKVLDFCRGGGGWLFFNPVGGCLL